MKLEDYLTFEEWCKFELPKIFEKRKRGFGLDERASKRRINF